ncbi:hypothetical protein JOQ06_014267, partial [Pogonophryne albipinna]
MVNIFLLVLGPQDRLDFGNCPQLKGTGSNCQTDLLLKAKIRIKNDTRFLAEE